MLVAEPLLIEAGSVVPAVVSSARSAIRGQTITACLGIGLSPDSHGMIMEHSGVGSPDEMESIVRQMVQESFDRRGLELERIIVRAVCHTVKSIGASVAAAVLWWR
jgi:arginine decarboxylase